MRKIFIILFSCCISMQLFAQKEEVIKTISVFPYQHVAESEKAIAVMQTWSKREWKPFLIMLDNDSLKLKASYALHAYTNIASLDPELKKQAAKHYSANIMEVKTFYARDLIIQQLGLLADEEAVKALTKLSKDPVYSSNAKMALESIHSQKKKS